MLGRLRLSIPEAKSAYEKLRPQVKLGFAERFQASRLEEELKNIFKDENMKDDRPDACNTYVFVPRDLVNILNNSQLCMCNERNEHECGSSRPLSLV